MPDLQTDIDAKDLNQSSRKHFADEMTKIAARQLSVSNKYKQPLVEKWKKYEDLKAGNIKKKLRVQFQVALPVFNGMLDTLAADFDEPVELSFKNTHPADFFKARRIQAVWEQERNKYSREARWDFKSRVDKSLNILHGRSILKEFASSTPKYKNTLDSVDPLLFHNQPQGGGLLENHLFCGEEGIVRTATELKTKQYDQAQVAELISAARSSDYLSETTEWNREKLQRFTVLGLDPESNSYTGEMTFNLVEWVLTYRGRRYYILFDPWTRIWVRFDLLKDIFSKDLYPWTSWATHEDLKVFWTMSYADIVYPVADSMGTLFNQELTNREKSNLGARAYDKDTWPDVAKLDEAQYRPDALVPFDSKGGTRAIGNSIYRFDTPQLSGTLQLLNWIDSSLQKETGITDISQGVAVNAAKKVNVAYLEQANIAKRLGYKSQSYTECWGEIGQRFIQGLKDHMSADMAIRILGDSGMEPDIMTRKDLDLSHELRVEVISSTAQKAENQKKKDARIKSIQLIAQDQNVNSEWKTAAILRDIGGYGEDDIRLALDTKNYAAQESVAKAHIAIEELIAGEEPELNFAADATFMKVIFDYSLEHRKKLGMDTFKKFTLYIAKHAKLALENAKRAGKARGMQNKRALMQKGSIPAETPVRPELAQVQ